MSKEALFVIVLILSGSVVGNLKAPLGAKLFLGAVIIGFAAYARNKGLLV